MTPDGRLFLYRNGERVEPVRAHVETTYERPKGDKVLRRVPLDNGELIVKADVALTQYENLLAIDTNTVVDEGCSISVAAILHCRFAPVGDGVHLVGAWRSNKLFEFRNVSEPPEKVAWKFIIEAVMRSPTFNPKALIGVVVDSDLGLIDQYNARVRPLIRNFFLPEGFELTYASADVGCEGIGNQLIRMCDREAAAMMKRVKEGANSAPLIKAKGEPYSHFRVWLLDEEVETGGHTLEEMAKRVSAALAAQPADPARAVAPTAEEPA